MNTQHLLWRKKIGKVLMVSAGTALVADAILWAAMVSGGIPGIGVTAVALIAGYLVFLFELPLLFIGPLLFLIGLMLVLAASQRSGVIVVSSGLITLVIGILAFVIPQMLVEPGSGDTTMAWMAGLTAILTGVPLILLGILVLLVGIVLVLKQFIPAASRKAREPM